MTKNILLVGVGGQGTILASKLLTAGLIKSGYNVKMSEIHGMSQRGGSVSSQIRYSKEAVYSPVIEVGGADILVSFEEMEAVRWLNYLKLDGSIIVNEHKISPMSVITGDYAYPEGLLEYLNRKVKTTSINAFSLAAQAGSSRTMNIVLLGALIKQMDLENIDWDTVISENVKPAFIDLNIKALKLGMEQI